ncbi:Asp-tRNA(Asn)/Glu-tRNA(Gln) amidotransferase GatCAB subunit B [Candidatus Poribacteria bacterium]|nr:Asp-tRNA(Asn)/Glu-tRNA(Gln) amidotransferase GatCAB subunit B [Candidatus Poribacteria bacterium]
MSKYETVIGLEIHAELDTNSKLFCNCDAGFGAAANANTCPICTGMPGVLPVANKKAIEYTIRAGLAMNCEIANYSKFDRKNYFYPDLPKGYQISQFDLPLCREGYVDFELNGEHKRVRINRIHLEEDAGKLIHGDVTGDQSKSYVDFNRSSVPLLEIVSEPDIRTPEEAIAYWRSVKEILEYIQVSDCNMEEGSFRCDANISLRLFGSEKLGTRTELKNKNSFQHVLAALKYEEKRQARLLDEGETVSQTTLLYDVNSGRTSPMRSKEESHDYRYFPEPDLVPFEIDNEEVKQIKADLPELPNSVRHRFTEEYDLPTYDAHFLSSSRYLASYFESAAKSSRDPKGCSNWIMGDLSGLLNNAGQSIEDCLITSEHISQLVVLINEGSINGKIGKTVIADCFESGKMPKKIIEEKMLAQISDSGELADIIAQVIAQNPKSVEDIQEGKTKAIGFLVGQVMKETKGKANPQLVNQILREQLGV